MLLFFAAENFRSINEEVELQLSAAASYHENDHELIDACLPGLSGVKFLRAASIHGPNASGKSTIWRALRTMQAIVKRSAMYKPDARLPYSPFAFSSRGEERRGTSFSIGFAVEGVRFDYRFTYDEKEVMEEELCAYPKGYRQVWYNRKGLYIKGSKHIKLPADMDLLLNKNTLVLSVLAAFPKYNEASLLSKAHFWLTEDLTLINRGPNSSDYASFYTVEVLHGTVGTEGQRDFVQKLIKRADLGIERADVQVEEVPEDFIEKMSSIASLLEIEDFDAAESRESKTVLFMHGAGGGSHPIQIDDESDGTKQLFALSGPVADALERGGVLFVDELDASLHPLIVRELIRVFLNPRSNPKAAQLILTAHNTCLLDDRLLRRDQVWFTEKEPNGGTVLYPLSDYKPRKGELVSAGYMRGRYSAVPVIPECLGLCPAHADQEYENGEK